MSTNTENLNLFKYDVEKDAWRIKTYSDSIHYASFLAKGGDIIVSFDIYFGSRHHRYKIVHYISL